jgi:hypothetical protein
MKEEDKFLSPGPEKGHKSLNASHCHDLAMAVFVSKGRSCIEVSPEGAGQDSPAGIPGLRPGLSCLTPDGVPEAGTTGVPCHLSSAQPSPGLHRRAGTGTGHALIGKKQRNLNDLRTGGAALSGHAGSGTGHQESWSDTGPVLSGGRANSGPGRPAGLVWGPGRTGTGHVRHVLSRKKQRDLND